jgi:alkanesulfonate monooxygenase SsuD/methylene tetrahydromethanopterin reductase-like flavin-dependent oxidoreductase (luciferase family)
MAEPAIRVGVQTLPNLPWPVLLRKWQYLEELGYDTAWDCDHFVDPYWLDSPWFEGWTLLAGLAARTERIRLGSLVTTITYRNPALLAREALTLDHISGGRLELAIGAGGAPFDARMTGVDEWEPPERVARFRAFVEIVDRLLRGEVVTRDETYYPLRESRMHPDPVQRPRPPLTLAAEGPAAMKVVADFADRWVTYGLHARSGVTNPQELADDVRQRNATLDELCVARDRDPASISRCLLVGLTAETPFASLDALEAFLGRYREAGITEFVVNWIPEDSQDTDYWRQWSDRVATGEMLERLAQEIRPRMR